MSGLAVFLGLSLSAITAGAISIPKQLESLAFLGRPLPIPPRFAVLQTSILSVIASAIGTVAIYLGNTPLSILATDFPQSGLDLFIALLIPTILITIIVFIGHMIIYYVIFRPRLRSADVITGEELRLRMGLPARILLGGIVEEIQFRWGPMTLIAWISLRILRAPLIPSLWFGILSSAFLFAAFHLAGSFQLGMNQDTSGKALTIIDNLWGGLFFGWLFWQYGLIATMISHALLHVFWSPFERILLERYKRGYTD